ncbi:DUF1775 domain-containing protein [Cupriavidus basilensis]
MVGHGCNGSATRAITVTIPEERAGRASATEGRLATRGQAGAAGKPVQAHGKLMTEDVRTLRWFGGTLADAHFDEFVMLMKLPEQGGKLYFPVLQECENGTAQWTQLPADGADDT